jgi:hypothetical protein
MIKQLSFLAILFLLPSLLWANPDELVIENHYNLPIHFQITINPQVVPSLTKSFNLAPSETTHTAVLDIGKEAYIAGNVNENSVFWGVERLNPLITIHGYISKGIAYSWNKALLIFCTPEEYKQKHHC